VSLASLVRELLTRGVAESPEHSRDLAAVEQFEGEQPELRVSWLRSITVIGGPNDPRMECAADPWLALIRTLVRSRPEFASKAARSWYAALGDAAFDTDEPIFHQALAAYVVGAIEASLGNDRRADRWLETGRIEGQIDGDEVSAFVEACALVRKSFHPQRDDN
jgi:hypothetical protein